MKFNMRWIISNIWCYYVAMQWIMCIYTCIVYTSCYLHPLLCIYCVFHYAHIIRVSVPELLISTVWNRCCITPTSRLVINIWYHRTQFLCLSCWMRDVSWGSDVFRFFCIFLRVFVLLNGRTMILTSNSKGNIKFFPHFSRIIFVCVDIVFVCPPFKYKFYAKSML